MINFLFYFIVFACVSAATMPKSPFPEKKNPHFQIAKFEITC